MTTGELPNRRRGFSLVEVNMAILVIALGMLVLFGLFPTGLREGENALVNTHTALFADAVFNGLRSESMQMNWEDWTSWMGSGVNAEIPGGAGWVSVQGQRVDGGVVTSVKYPTDDETIYYVMEVGGEPTDVSRRVWLWVKSAKQATDDPDRFKLESMVYRCGYFYGSGRNQSSGVQSP